MSETPFRSYIDSYGNAEKDFPLKEFAARKRTVLLLHTLTHFAVDFASYFILMRTAWELPFLTVAVIYTLLAFSLQFLIGLFSDKFSHAPVLILGLGLMVLGFWPGELSPLILTAVGNAFFHTYAGRTILSSFHYGENGIFNGAGGLGLVLGTYFGLGTITFFVPLILLVFLLGAQVWLYKMHWEFPPVHGAKRPYVYLLFDHSRSIRAAMLVLLFLAAVFLEAALALSRPIFSRETWPYLLIGVFVFGFKVLGSYLFEQKFSAKLFPLALLLVFLLELLAGMGVSQAAFIMLLLFNLYPLYGLKQLLPHRAGTAFGINKLALSAAFFLGLMPRSKQSFAFILIILIIISLIVDFVLEKKEISS